MRVLVFGRKRTVQKLIPFLAREGVEVVIISDGLTEMIALEKQYVFDLAIVDSLAAGAEAACHHINKFWAIPLVLTLSAKRADWKRLQPLATSGYLAMEAENGELTARLRAVLRRLCPSLKASLAEQYNTKDGEV